MDIIKNKNKVVLMENKQNFRNISKTVSSDIFENNINEDWDYDLLSLNVNITDDIVEKYSYKPWNYIKMSIRKDMKYRFNKYDK